MNPNKLTINYGWYWNCCCCCFNYNSTKKRYIVLFQIKRSMCAAPRSICIFVCIVNNHKVHNTHTCVQTMIHLDPIIAAIATTRTLHSVHSNWCLVCRSLNCDVLAAWEWERKCQIFWHLTNRRRHELWANSNVNGPLYVITVRWSIKSLSLFLVVFVQRNTVKFSTGVLCVFVFLYIFSLIHLWIGKQNGRSVTYTFVTEFKSNATKFFNSCLTFYFAFAHTRIHDVRIQMRARTQHAQMKMRSEIRKTSTMIKRRYEIHTQIACIVDMMYIIFITANQLIFCPHRRADRYKHSKKCVHAYICTQWQ